MSEFIMPMSIPESDGELVKRWRAGDERAAEALVDRHLPALRAQAQRALRGALRRRVGASDAIQEACLAASLRLDDFQDRGEGSFGRWLAQILDHKLRDEIRRHLGSQKRDVRYEVGSMSTEHGGRSLVSKERSPSTAAAEAEQKDALSRAMAAMSRSHRAVLRLVHEEGLTLALVATRTGRAASSVSRLYGRALAALSREIHSSTERRNEP